MSDEHMSDKDMDAVLREWTQDAPAGQPDRSRVVGDVVRQIGSTRRRRRRWWLQRLFSRKPDEPAAIDETQSQPNPIPASNGHTPTVIGRTSSMLTPVKAITAGALVFAIGGALLIAQPFQQQSSVPGAEAEDVAATWVTGDVRYASSCSGPDTEMDGDVRRDRNYECSPQTWTASDPRFSGQVSRRWNEDVYRTEDGGYVSVNIDAAYLRNDEGGWACLASNLFKGSGLFPSELTGETFTCTGEGGYEGLSAIVVNEQGGSNTEEFVGLIFAGDFPPLPEPLAAE